MWPARVRPGKEKGQLSWSDTLCQDAESVPWLQSWSPTEVPSRSRFSSSFVENQWGRKELEGSKPEAKMKTWKSLLANLISWCYVFALKYWTAYHQIYKYHLLIRNFSKGKDENQKEAREGVVMRLQSAVCIVTLTVTGYVTQQWLVVESWWWGVHTMRDFGLEYTQYLFLNTEALSKEQWGITNWQVLAWVPIKAPGLD